MCLIDILIVYKCWGIFMEYKEPILSVFITALVSKSLSCCLFFRPVTKVTKLKINCVCLYLQLSSTVDHKVNVHFLYISYHAKTVINKVVKHTKSETYSHHIFYIENINVEHTNTHAFMIWSGPSCSKH